MKKTFSDPFCHGPPVFSHDACPACPGCVQACPVGAISFSPGQKPLLDAGKCLGCGVCQKACPKGLVSASHAWDVHAFSRDGLMAWTGEKTTDVPLASLCPLTARCLALLDLKRCACMTTAKLLSPWLESMGHYGVQWTEDPQEAEAVIIFGPVFAEMQEPIQAYLGESKGRFLVAAGACAISGGVSAAEGARGIGDILKADLFVAGCPPSVASLALALARLFSGKRNAR